MTEANDFLMGGGGKSERRKSPPMEGVALEVASRLKELFYHYDNRRSSDNRSAQAHLGPSEIGTPCDRRLAMSLLRVPRVNPGGDGWAAFVGTCIHVGLAEMLNWANAGTGRYATELPLSFPSVHVPRGTGDVLDRVLCMFADHKCMGSSSLSKLRLEGPSDTYRVQVHTYGYGATLRGEQVDHVAIVAWPREAGTLSGLHVWTEPYDERVALEAMERVDRIADATARGLHWKYFATADECRFCPYKGRMEGGCAGHED